MTPRAMSVKSVAAAYDVSETTVRQAIDHQELPAYRVGRMIRVAVDDADEWFHSLVRVGSEADR